MPKRAEYETDNESFPHDYYRVQGYAGIAFYVLGWELEYGTEWVTCTNCDGAGCIYCEDGGCEEEYERRTGRVLAVMVGDDYKHKVDPEDITPLAREDFCGECGQIGCTHDGLDREGE